MQHLGSTSMLCLNAYVLRQTDRRGRGHGEGSDCYSEPSNAANNLELQIVFIAI